MFIERRQQRLGGHHLAFAHEFGIAAAWCLHRRQSFADPVRLLGSRSWERFVGGAAGHRHAQRRADLVDRLFSHQPIGRQLPADDAP